MTSSLATSGWLCDVNVSGPPIIVVQASIVGVLLGDDVLSGVLEDDYLTGLLAAPEVLAGSLAEETITGLLEEDPGVLVGVLLCNGEAMTDIEIPRGDSRALQVTVYQSDGTTPVDLTDAVIRFAVKERPGSPNASAKVFKTSYLPDEVQITAPLSGQCVVKLRVDDTVDLEPGTYRWEIEVTRKGTLASSAGTLAFTTGSSIAVGTGLDFDALRVGQYVEPAGGFAGNQEPVLITALDGGAGTVSFDGYAAFVTEAGVTFNAYEGDRKTPTGLSGSFTVCPDVVR